MMREMRRIGKVVSLLLAAFLLTGCWNRVELLDKGFVMGVAIQSVEPEIVHLTVQIFKPSQKAGGQGGSMQKSFININTKGRSIFEAVRDITLHLGRKAQWSHMRIIILDEQTARTNNLLSLLEYFYRDHEARITTRVLITKGEPSEYLKVRPMIEQTISQQFNKTEENASGSSGKALTVNLLRLAQALKSEVPNTILPIATLKPKGEATMSGLAVIRDSKMVGTMSASQTEDLLMLTNQFKKGILNVPCIHEGEGKGESEAIEVQSVRTTMKPIIQSGKLRVQMTFELSGNIGSLRCTKLEKRSDEKAFVERIQQMMEARLLGTIRETQKREVDLLGIGNALYRKNPRVWKQWKQDWGARYAEADIELKGSVRLLNTLTIIGKPIYMK
ncbi:germination protein, Ger(x)C family [Paenibacillus curdlanolyticus YK9]|uniref:Germination protein, Ger(X)C family n=1 Tax=Paenibacillus curdlanolyticus YK9 TaxID=717606 RepID=E0ID06_9BACL|nr:Ger(x)C family spore germination protein [Paenibacillus curdlanolyticus]EFM09461.1 germination protein, Ger(x)C family [Paenibacillus curdlanolyticus YK9]